MRLMTKIILIICIAASLFAIPAIFLLFQNQQKITSEQAYIQAKAIYKMIIITRQWVADNSEDVAAVPAVVTKELAEYAKNMTAFRFRITGEKAINPENIPNEFEKEIIQKFKTREIEEYSDIYTDNKTKYYRYAAPLTINHACLKCHEYQQYSAGDVKGLISVTFPLDKIESSISSSATLISYIVIPGLILLIIILSLSIYLLVIRHLRTLEKAANSIKSGTMLETNIQTHDEIQTLSKAFDQMSKTIANNEEILKHKLDQAVAKYINLVTELENKNEKLNSLNKLKSDLLDSIAHEIRTPLTKVLLYSELMQDQRITSQPENTDKMAISFKKNVKVIKNMFNAIITLSRLEHDQHQFYPIPINIRSLINDIILDMDYEIQNKNLTMNVDIEEVIIEADGETFNIAVSNIISNAIKYSYKNTTIDIIGKTNTDKNVFILTFKDEGVGIASEDLPELFKRFHRGENIKKDYPGTGLGLSIVKRILDAHQFNISVESELKKWTKVTIEMSLDRQHVLGFESMKLNTHQNDIY